MDMSVYTDGGQSKSQIEDEVCSFPSHAGKCRQFLHRVRNLPPVLAGDDTGHFPDALCLGPVETRRVDQFFYCGFVQRENGVGVIGDREEPIAGREGHLVLGSERNHC